MTPETQIDVAIIGAGISGISMAAHVQTMCPGTSFAMFERRDQLGGTWDLFRYPGVRSDSDMHTLGFRFEPWIHEKAIADGEAILDYLGRIVSERGIDKHIRFGSKVIGADWRSDEARWHLTVEDGQGWYAMTARFLYLASGYYDYDDPHDARLPGLAKFAGTVVHPQFWPQDLDYAGKRVVVIGSGATAVTIVPAMTGKATHVTMLQRTPTWMASGPSRDKWANRARRWLPGWLGYWLTRQKNIRLHQFFFKKARSEPGKVGEYLTGKLREELGEAYSEEHFQPPYGPWQQRLCLVPDSDFFAAVKAGQASVTTGHIESFEKDGVRLTSGELLPADVVVTATGLRLALGGKIAVSLDGRPVDWADHWFYRGCLFSNVPNLAVVFGYLNASWTLRADNNADYVCRVINRMADKRADVVVPYLPDDHGLAEDDIIVFSSGYLQRAKTVMPKSAPALPWRLNQDYLEDCRDFRKRPVDDGVLRFEKLPRATEAGVSGERIWTAALVVIGDEILSGRTHDKNIAQVASWLQVQGIRLAEVRVVPDVEERIAEAVNALRVAHDYLFTTGGIGPTHDDITVDAMARALGVPVVVHPEARAILEAYYAGRGGLNPARLRMARVPEGAELIPNRMSGAPGIKVGNVFMMAGVPAITAQMLDALTGSLEGGAPLLSETIGGWIQESAVADILREVEKAHPQCQIGSYPFFREGKTGSNFVIRSTDPDELRSCVDTLCEALGEDGQDFTPGGI